MVAGAGHAPAHYIPVPLYQNTVTVPLLDLKAQYATLKTELDAALLAVAESQYFILGDHVRAMEQEMARYLGVRHALGVSSGTDALLLALMALNIGPGDQVVAPTFSFFATAGVVWRLGARPVFADVDPVSFNILPESLERVITPHTKAIVPVHLFGQSADMDAVMQVASARGIPVIEDAAQAIGTRYADGRTVGSIGLAGCFSFFPTKNLGCFGDGGLVTTNDDELFERMRIMRVHGGQPKYYHHVVGGNFRLDEMQAAVLRVKLPHLDGWSAARARNADLYTNLLMKAGLSGGTGALEFDSLNRVLLPRAMYAGSGAANSHIYNQYVLRVQNRDALREHLAQNGVGTEIYYPVPLHLQKCFAELGHSAGDFPNAERLAAEVLALPIYPELTAEQITHVVQAIAGFVGTIDD